MKTVFTSTLLLGILTCFISSCSMNSNSDNATDSVTLESVTLSFPPDASNCEETSQTLTWTVPSGNPTEVTYSLKFGLDDPPKEVYSVDTNKYEAINLEEGKTYYWQVVATTLDGETKESPIFSFDTKNERKVAKSKEF